MSKEPHYVIAPIHFFLMPFTMNLMIDAAYRLNLKLQLSQCDAATLSYYILTMSLLIT